MESTFYLVWSEMLLSLLTPQGLFLKLQFFTVYYILLYTRTNGRIASKQDYSNILCFWCVFEAIPNTG
jgi:hypothetical protein